MPTVAGHGLGGSADGGEPGWEERVKASVNGIQTAKRAKQRRHWDVSLILWMDFPFRALIREAATARGMSVSGYMRRATAAYLSRDLGMPLEDIVKHTPRPAPASGVMDRPAGQNPRDRRGRLPDDGKGYGDWTLPKFKEEGD